MENFPYSNFHDLNLDWIVKEHKKLCTQQTTLANRVNTLAQNVNEISQNVEQQLTIISDTVSELAAQISAIEVPQFVIFSGTIQEALDEGILISAHSNLYPSSRITIAKYGRIVYLYCYLRSVSSTIANGTVIMTLSPEWIPLTAYQSSPSFASTTGAVSPYLSINGHVTGSGSGAVTLRGSTISTTQRMYYATYINYEG